jgi:tyrosinase
MDSFHAHEVTLPPSAAAGEFTRADLVFYGVEHRGPSFEARVFLNTPEANVDTELNLESGYAGSFVIFGHGGCFGDSGHCEVPPEARDPFDKRPPHGMAPLTKLVEITDALKRARGAGDTIDVTVVPVQPSRRQARQADVLFFTGLRLLTYR